MSDESPRDFLANWLRDNPPGGMLGSDAKEEFLTLAWLVNAPPGLQYFPHALLSFIEVLEVLYESVTVDDDRYLNSLPLNIQSALKVLRHLFSHREQWMLERAEFQLPINPGTGNPYRRLGMVNHSFYATLMTTHEDDGLVHEYRMLQGAVFVLHADLMANDTKYAVYLGAPDRHKILEKKNNSAYEATRVVRDASYKSNESEFSDLLNIEGIGRFIGRQLTCPVERHLSWPVDAESFCVGL